MGGIIVVVASHEGARIFHAEAGAGATLEEKQDLLNPAARPHGRDMESDRAGRYAAESGSSVHGMEREQGAKEAALARYARAVAAVLNAEHHAGRCERIYLVADPHVLGELRRDLDASTRAAVAGEVSKNLVKHSLAEIRAHLPERL